jgi:fatty-acyl-CoA synthase
VVGRPSERWGQEVVAVVELRPGRSPTDADLRAAAAAHVARYKLPKAVVRVSRVERSPSGKPDYRWAAAQVGSGPPQ